MTALALLVLGGVQVRHFRAGDHWAMDRTVRFVSTVAEIDMQNDDHFEFAVVSSDGKLSLDVARRQLGTHLSDEKFVPAPPDGEPEKWSVPVSADGKLTLGRQPNDGFERMLARVLVSALNGAASSEDKELIRLNPLASGRERIVYDASAVQSPEKLEGEVSFDSVTHLPVLISLRGENVLIPGGSDRVSVKVEYRRPS